MTRRDINEANIVQQGLDTLADQAGAAEGDVPTVGADGAVAFATPEAGPGGSRPGALVVKQLVFTEPAAPHADMTATLDIPAGGNLLDMTFIPLIVSFADTVLLDVVDGDGNTYFDAFQVGPADYWIAYAAEGRTKGPAGNDFDVAGNQTSDYAGAVEWTDPTQNSRIPGVPYPDGTTITATVSGIDTGGGGGKFILRVLYTLANDAAFA